jgi:drug/metabolite transporter (DMT)-like permease
LLSVAVFGISLSGPVSAATVAPVLAVAFWRNLVGAGVTGIFVAMRQRDELRQLDRRTILLTALSGLMLAIHFASWLAGLRMTSVAVATALVNTSPAVIVAIELARGRKVPRLVIAGVVLALAGMLAVTGVDAGSSLKALAGDLLSLLGGVAAAFYILLGESVQRRTSTGPYTLLAYGTCAALLLPAALLTGQRLAGFDLKTWLELAIVTLGAQLLGHTLLNAAIPLVGSTPVALTALLEIPGAAVIAWVWLGQVPGVTIIPGTVLMVLGLVLVLVAGHAQERPPPDIPPN